MTVIHPGRTIGEFLEGRRRKYFNPVTILLMLSGLFAVLSVATGYVDVVPKESSIPFGQYANMIRSDGQSHPAMLHLLLLPFTALALKWLFRRVSDLSYVEYVYIGIFSAIFAVVLLLLRMPFDLLLPAEHPAGSCILFLCIVAQGWFAVTVYRTLFGVTWKRAVWSWLGVLIISYGLGLLALILVAGMVIGIYYLITPEAFIDTDKQLVSPADANAVQGIHDVLRESADSLRTK